MRMVGIVEVLLLTAQAVEGDEELLMKLGDDLSAPQKAREVAVAVFHEQLSRMQSLRYHHFHVRT